MAKYTVTDPSGKEWDLEGPEGASDATLVKALKASREYQDHYAQSPKSVGPVPVPKVAPDVPPLSFGTEQTDLMGERLPTIDMPNSVFHGQPNLAAPRDIKEVGGPLSVKGQNAVRQAYELADEKKRQQMTNTPGWIGSASRAVGQQYQQAEKAVRPPNTEKIIAPSQVLPTLGGRREDMVRGSDMDPRAAEMEIAAGRDPRGMGTIEETDFDFDRQALFQGDNKLLNNPLVGGVMQGGERLAQAYIGIDQFVGDLFGLDTTQLEKMARASQMRDFAIGENKDPMVRNLQGAIASLTSQLPNIVGTVVSGQAAPALAAMIIQSFGQEYLSGQRAGLDKTEAATRAAIFAAFEGIGERFALSKFFKPARHIFKDVATKDLKAALASYVLRDIPGEELTTLGQFLTDKLPRIGTNREAGLNEYLTQVADTLFQTIMQGGITYAGGVGAVEARNRAMPKGWQIGNALNEDVQNTSFTKEGINNQVVRSMSPTGGIPGTPHNIDHTVVNAGIPPVRTDENRQPEPRTFESVLAEGKGNYNLMRTKTAERDARGEAAKNQQTGKPESERTTASGYVMPEASENPLAPPDDDDGYLDSLGSAERRTVEPGYEESFGSAERPMPNYGEGYEDSLGGAETWTPSTPEEVEHAANLAGQKAVQALPEDATDEERARAFQEEYKAVQAKQEAPGEPTDTSPSPEAGEKKKRRKLPPIKDAQATLDFIDGLPKEAQAKYRELRKRAKDKLRREQRLNQRDAGEVTSGEAISQTYYPVDQDIEAIDRVWGNSGDIFMPWYLGRDYMDPHKIDYKNAFIVYKSHMDKWAPDMMPSSIAKMLYEFVPWLRVQELPVPNNWKEFQAILGPVFIANGYDAFSFRDTETPYLVPFDPKSVEKISKFTAKTIEGEKMAEHTRQLKSILWTKKLIPHDKIVKNLEVLKGFIENDLDVLVILQEIIDNPPTRAIQGIAKQLYTAIESQQRAGLLTTITLSEANEPGTSGLYELDEDGGNIILMIHTGGMTYRTLIHELIHAVTIPALATVREVLKDPNNELPADLIKRYETLQRQSAEFYAFVQRALPALELTPDNLGHNETVNRLVYNQTAWTENVHEVLAYALTEIEFQKLLHNIPVKEGNGLWHLTDKVREFHGIDESMDTLFYEAVKLFNEFATFPFHLIPDLPQYLLLIKAAPYAAQIQIRGPPDIDRAIKTFEGFYGEMQAMNGGHLPWVYELGHKQLETLNTKGTTKFADFFPLHDGTEAVDFLVSGNLPQRKMAPAPMYVMGIGKARLPQMSRKGLEKNGVHYYLVGNVKNSSFNEAMRKTFPKYYLTQEEAAFILEHKRDIWEAIKPWYVQNETYQKLELLPHYTKAALPKDIQSAMDNQQRWMDPATVDEAVELWRKMGSKDLPNSYKFVWNQFVSGSETAASLTNNPVIALVRGRVGKAIAEQSQVSKNIIEPLGVAYLDMSRKERRQIMQVLIKGDRAEVEHSGLVLRQMGMNDKQIAFYRMVRQAADYDFELWNEMRARIGLPPIPYRVGYLPSLFEGDWKSVAKVMVKDKNGDLVPEVVGVVTAMSTTHMARIKKQVEQKVKGVFFEDLPKRVAGGPPVPGELFDVMSKLTDVLGPQNPEIEKIGQLLQEYAKFDEGRYLGFHVHEMAKKGVWGSEGDKFWENADTNAEDAFEAIVRFFEEGSAHHHSLVFMQEMDRLFTDPDLNKNAPNTILYLKELYNHILRHHPKTGHSYSPVANFFKFLGSASDMIVNAALVPLSPAMGPTRLQKMEGSVRYAFATWAMGMFNMAFTAMQLLQVPLFAPQMAMITRRELGLNFTEGRSAAMKAAYVTSHYIMHHFVRDLPGVGKKGAAIMDQFLGKYDSDPEMKIALQYAEANNLINFTDIERTVEKTLNPNVGRLDRLLNANQRYAEALTRPLVFLWVFGLERSAGVPVQAALEAARHKTQFVMVPYDLRDRPMMYASLGFYGQMLGQLKTFLHSSISQQWYYTKIIATQKQIKPFLYGAAMSVFASGQMGIIGMQDADNLVRAVNQKVLKQNIGIKEVLAEVAPIAVQRGLLSEWTGVDFYSRLRSPAVVQIPLWQSVIPNSTQWAYNMAESALKAAKGGKEFFKDLGSQDAGSRWKQVTSSPDFQKGVTGLASPMTKPWLEEAFSQDGYMMKYDEKNPPLKAYKRNDFDWTVRKFGFRSTEEAKKLEMDFDLTGDKMLAYNTKEEVVKEIRKLVARKNYTSEEMNNLMREFIAAGGSVKEYVQLRKEWFVPETVEQKFEGKPSMKKGEYLNFLNKLKEDREK